jgi:endonuclease/exonuclease/phosphatase family metal-dependent hydrolase
VDSRLRVITYNIRKGKGPDGRSPIEMSAIGRALSEHSADVVLCQEVFHCARTGDSQSGGLARAMNLPCYYGANKFRTVGHHGNSTFTHHTVDHFVNHDISTNRIERRGALYVRLMLQERPLHVFNVHLGLNGWQRMSQVKAIEALLGQLAAPHDPVLLAGDFNDWRLELDRRIVGELGFSNALGEHDPAVGRTWHARRPVFALDRIYTRNLRVERSGRFDGEPWSGLSDHLPLFAELSVA